MYSEITLGIKKKKPPPNSEVVDKTSTFFGPGQ